MKSTGIVRKMDALGRIVIPVELRQKLNLSQNDLVELREVDGKVVLSKHSSSECIFCNSSHNLSYFKGQSICRKCLIAAQNTVDS
ncbi:MAG: AbrB/MazE/SpoVT family DNA-binding domain-containing protein [Sporomusaceae bacterium]|nr:AbrB/MazE/SpoVT family DNA-binding domain-containing protein [Sporomusaceae bacterium]